MFNVNQSTTEIYTIRNSGGASQKSCRYHGSLPDSTSDVTQRKQLAFDVFNTIRRIYYSKKVSIAVKIRLQDVLKAYFVTTVSFGHDLQDQQHH